MSSPRGSARRPGPVREARAILPRRFSAPTAASRPQGGKRVVGFDGRVQDRAAAGDGLSRGHAEARGEEEPQLLRRDRRCPASPR